MINESERRCVFSLDTERLVLIFMSTYIGVILSTASALKH